MRASLHGIPVTYLTSADGARATVADHGAHLLSWQPAGGSERLFLSPASGFGAGQAIRGGVPVIFPQFGERGSGRRHGVARLQPWQFCKSWQEDAAALGQWQLRGMLEGNPGASAAAPAGSAGSASAEAFCFALTLTVRLCGDGISLSLRIDNTGTRSWQCHAALHTYLQVNDVAGAVIDGLQGLPFIDNAAPLQKLPAAALAPEPRLSGEASPVRFAGEVDRLYPGAPSRLILIDGAARLILTQEGFADTVVWNPGAAKGAALADLPPAGHARFVCIEAAAVVQPVLLAPGGSWCGIQTLRAA